MKEQEEREGEPKDNQVDHFQVTDMDFGGQTTTTTTIITPPLNLLASGNYLAQ